MYLTVRKRLELLINTEDKIRKRVLVLDPRRPQFGFRHMQQLFPVDFYSEIKGVPTVAYNNHTDHMKFAIKIIPLENRYEKDVHPSHLEVTYLRELTGLVRNYHTPHIGYYFTHFEVKNNVKALTCFPLKEFRHELYKDSLILIAEFVSGGSLEEWIQTDETAVIADGVWKYIIFSVVWTMFILQDKYRLMHCDLHFGNILIDTCLNSQDKLPVEYRLQVDGKPRVFHVPSLGVLPKIWDTEFAHTSNDSIKGVYPNRFGAREDNIPNYFNPVYDLHCFLASLMELNIPTSVREFILSIYPPELIPDAPARRHRSFGDRSDDYSSRGSESGSEEEGSEIAVDDNFSLHSEDYTDEEREESGTPSDEVYWRTDETMDTSQHTEDADNMLVDEEDGSRTGSGDEEDSDGSQIRTEFLLGERMLNGSETKFVGLPTPYSLLHHPYFDEYVVQPHPTQPGSKVKKPSVVFQWSTRYDPALDVTKPPKVAAAAKGSDSGKPAGAKKSAERTTRTSKAAAETAAQAVKDAAKPAPPSVPQPVVIPSKPAPLAKPSAKPVLKNKVADTQIANIDPPPAKVTTPMPVPGVTLAGGGKKKVPVLRAGPTPPKGRR